MFTFYWPWLILLLPLPLLVRKFLAPVKETSGNNIELYFPYIDKLNTAFARYKSDNSKNQSRWFIITISLLWLSLVLAIMRPEKVDQLTSVKSKGHDLMLAVDLSGSMKALDFSTREKLINRLDMVKEVAGNFISKRQGDRLGLIVFGEHAYLYAPMSLDLSSIKTMLDNTVPGMAGDSTAIGDAIGLAVHSLRERPQESRILVLLTDGDDNASSIPPLEAAKLAKQYNIRIYTIGIGHNGDIPFPDGMGGITTVQVSMDDTLLKEIAKTTDGQYFLATDVQALESIYDHIDKIEKTESAAKIYMIREPLYSYPLGVAMILLLVVCSFLVVGRIWD